MSTLTTIRYCLQKSMNTKSTSYGKYYAKPVSQGTVNLDELAAHISDHGSVYTRDVVVGVMTKMVDCINELLAQGYKVKLGELGTFYNSIRNALQILEESGSGIRGEFRKEEREGDVTVTGGELVIHGGEEAIALDNGSVNVTGGAISNEIRSEIG